ncbi:hypothetical protein TNCV_5124361 [Trichonephila clavipes]|nr:hypothetical protein TNCV_5124361 [Trichonephila clavipes]
MNQRLQNKGTFIVKKSDRTSRLGDDSRFCNNELLHSDGSSVMDLMPSIEERKTKMQNKSSVTKILRRSTAF